MRVTPTAVFLATLATTAALAQQPHVRSVVEPEAAIGQTITLRVDGNLPECKTLILFIQRSPIHGLKPRCAPGTVAFDLVVNDKNAEKWHEVLGRHWISRTVTVGLGPNDELPYPSDVSDYPFRLIKPWRTIVIIVVMFVLIAGIVVVRMKTTYLNSIPRMQVALWIVIIAASYTYIWSVTGETETINGTALALVAIGTGTAAGASLLGSAKTISAKALIEGIQNMDQADLTPVESPSATGLHAVMIASWTILLAIVFIVTVYRFLVMPAFSGEVLAVLGIAGGTYAAFAMPRQH